MFPNNRSTNKPMVDMLLVNRSTNKPMVERIHRYVITKFLTRKLELRLVAYEIKCVKTGVERNLELRDMWSHAPDLEVGTIVNICNRYPDENGDYSIERNFGFLIVEPDKLISVTNVVGMSWCERKIAFSEYFRFPVENTDTLRGTIAHDLICQTMMKKKFQPNEILAELDAILKHPVIMEKAYGLNLSHQELTLLGEDLVKYIGSVKRLMTPVPKNDPTNRKLEILSVRDIEDCYWSPKYGLKGKVDCTVETIDNIGQHSVLPMEFKTGRSTSKPTEVRNEHLGQVYLYSLMMGRTDLIGPNGVLHYIRDMHTVESTASMGSLQSLIMARNRIVMNITSIKSSVAFTDLPSPCNVNFEKQCNHCEYRNVCALSIGEPRHYMKPTETEIKLRQSISYLTSSEKDFFNKWLEVIKLESDDSESSYTTKNLWLHSISKRESAGKCIGNLTLKYQSTESVGHTTLVTFEVDQDRRHLILNFTEKDYIVVGTFKEPCIGFAFIEGIKQDSVTVSIDGSIVGRHSAPGTKFTINKVSSNSAGMMQYVYLSWLMDPEAGSLRRRLILKEPPMHKKLSVNEIAPLKTILTPFNQQQRTALMKCVSTDSMLMIKGSPGCGKTTTLVGLIRLLILMKKTVLVTAYTSNALDNILLAYKKYSNNFIRIGSPGKLNEALLKEHCTNHLRDTAETTDQLQELFDSKPVVGTTLLSVKHAIFANRRFDYCIVDEGSQALPTVVIGALLKADRQIIFGDPNQLPAVLKSRKIKEMNVEENLFSMLKDPAFSYDLNVQYRMNQVIMKLSNHLVYDNKMKCGSEEQAIMRMTFPAEPTKKYLAENFPLTRMQNWISLTLSRKPQRSVMFLDTESIEAYESVVASTLQNKKERDIVATITSVFVGCKVPAEDIGIIAPYRGQVQLIQESLSGMGIHNVEVNTVDQYQGREKGTMIVSFTKSIQFPENETPSEASILNDMRRLNVALTRAKTKIILIGNSTSLDRFPPCQKLLSILQDIQKYTFCADDFHEGFFE